MTFASSFVEIRFELFALLTVVLNFDGEDQRRLPSTKSRTPELCGGPGPRGLGGWLTTGIETKPGHLRKPRSASL